MNKLKTYNVLFCGTGGQGVLKAAEVLCWAAIFAGFHTKKSEVHGMAQRGGSVESHVRFGLDVFSPLIPEGSVEYLVSFHKDEHARMRHFLKKSGVDLILALEKAHEEVSDKRFTNMYLLGCLSGYLPIEQESWFKAIELVFAGKFLEENKKIFLSGCKK